MGLLDKVGGFVRKTVLPAVTAPLKPVVREVAERVPEPVKDGFEALPRAGRELVRLGAQLPSPGEVLEGAQTAATTAGSLLRRRAEGVVDGLQTRVGNVVSDVRERVGDAVDLAQEGAERVGDALRTGGRFALGAARVAIDAGQRTIDFADDVVDNAREAAVDTLKFAAQHGLQLAGRALEGVHSLAHDSIDRALGVGEKIDGLGVGDSYTVGAEVGAKVGLGVEVEGGIQVRRTDEGYVVSGEVGAEVGLKAGGGVNGSLGGKAQFTFDSPEEARRAALILASAGATAASPVLAPALAPRPEELAFLQQNLKSVEVSGAVGAEVGAKFDVLGAEGGAGAGVEVEGSFAVEFENGRPVALTRTTELEGEAGAGAGLGLFQKQAGAASAAGLLNLGGEVEGKLKLKTSIPLDSTQVGDLAAFLASPTTAAFAGEATTSISAEVTADGGPVGGFGKVELGGIGADEARGVVSRLLRGDFDDALEGVDATVSGSLSTFRDREVSPGIDLDIGGVGLKLEGRSSVRDVTVREQFSRQLGGAPERLAS